MYDVIYIDSHGGETSLAKDLTDKQAAKDLACRVACERKAGRMMLPGSANKIPNTVYVVPVPDSLRHAA
jgi:hypothetical protein